ncbi:MAG: hypothetical protein QW215_00100 [Ignisphaera sp.]
MSETMSQNNQTQKQQEEERLNNIKKETEKIVKAIEYLYEKLKELSKYNEEIEQKISELVKKWRCVQESLTGYYRDCAFSLQPSEKAMVFMQAPDTVRIEVDNVRINELKEIIKNALINEFHYQLLATAEKVKDIIEISRRTINKVVNIKEMYEKIDRLYEQVQVLRNKLEELQEGYDLLKDIEELREERAELIQEIENLKNLKHDLRKEIRNLKQQQEQEQQQ